MLPDLLISRLRAIRDPRMRALALIEAFGEGAATTWVHTLEQILARAQVTDDADAQAALECIAHATGDPALGYERRQELYEAAVAEQLPAIARLFLTTSPAVDVPVTLRKQLGPERPLRPAGRPLTLGERKSLARTHRRDQLLLLLRDPHPAVVEILLDNPHVTEPDIVRVAATRPAAPEALLKIVAHPRWSVRHAVKRALVLNPATPLVDAMRIATTLRPSDLAEIAADPAVPEALRVHAAEVRAAALKQRP